MGGPSSQGTPHHRTCGPAVKGSLLLGAAGPEASRNARLHLRREKQCPSRKSRPSTSATTSSPPSPRRGRARSNRQRTGWRSPWPASGAASSTDGPVRERGRAAVIRLPRRPSFHGGAGPGTPGPHTARARRRYAAMLREASAILDHLPQPGESLHALMTGLYDFMTLVAHVITNRPAPCEVLRIATLAFSSRNTAELVQLLDGGAVQGV